MSAAVIGALRVVLGLETAAFTEGLKAAKNGFASAGKSLQGIGQKLSANVTAPIAAVGSALAALAIKSADAAVELQNQARLANASLTEFQKFAAGARTVGLENEKLSDILKDVNDKVGEFLSTGGGEMSDFFTKIAPKVGITAEAFRGLSGPQALQLYVSSLEKAGVSQQEMTFYMEAIADEATSLVPLLANGGAEMQRLGDRAEALGLTQEGAAESGRAFKEAMNSMRDAIANLGNVLVESGLLDTLAALINRVADWVAQLRGVNPDLVNFGVVFAGIAAAIGPVLVGLGLLVTALAAVSTPVLAVVAAIAAVTAGLVAFWPEIVKTKDAVIALGTEALDWIKAKFDEVSASLSGLRDRFTAIGQDIIDGLLAGLRAKWEAVKAWFSGLADGIPDWVRERLGIHSPSTVFADIGQNIMLGLSDGLEREQDGISSSVGSFAQSLAQQFKGLITGATDVRGAIGSLLGTAGDQLIDAGINGIFTAVGVPGFARGTESAPGGIARINELGGEIVDLPKGSRVIPHDLSKRMVDKSAASAVDGKAVIELSLGPDLEARILRQAEGQSVRIVRGSQPATVKRSVAAVREANRESSGYLAS